MPNRLLDSETRRRIVDELTNAKPRALTAAELAERVGLHTSSVRFHLDQLVAGRVLATDYERRGVGRPRKVYLPVEPGADDGHNLRSLELLTGLLTQTFAARSEDQPLTPDQAGEAWARENIPARPPAGPPGSSVRWDSTLDGLSTVLKEWGYLPEINAASTGTHERATEIRLPHCPFRDLAKANPAVVCGIHRGLIRGTLHQLGETGAEVELLPFAEGDICIAHLARSSQPDSPAKESS